MVKQLIFFYFSSFELIQKVVPYFDNLIIVVDVASYKIIKVSFQPADDLSALDSEIY